MRKEKPEFKLKPSFDDILHDYVQTCNVCPFEGSIVIADDMLQSYLSVRQDLVESGKVNPNEVGKYNGLTVQPKDVNGEFTVLINKGYLLDCQSKHDKSWVGTIVHEATHVNDFKEYFRMVSPASYDELYDYNLHRMFLYWTEFHAKAMGYFFLRKYTFDDVRDQRQAQDIVRIELPFQIKYMVQEINATNDADRQMYVVVHFLGRLAVWQELFPTTFNRRFIGQLIGDNQWMEELYYLLIEHNTLEKIYPVFDQMKSILDKHFS